MPRRPSPRFAAVALAVVALAPLASCTDDRPDPFDDARCETLLNDPKNADALDWLKAPAPVPRRPGTMPVDDAMALVHKFDARGAVRVIAVGNRTIEPPAAKGPYFFSLGLVIRLPDEPAKRYAVFQLYADQVRTIGYAPRADVGQKYLFVGWPQD